MSGPAIDPCGLFHAEVLAELHAQCFAEAWDAEALRGLLATPGTFGLLAMAEDQPIGMVLCRGGADECEILTLAVAGAARRRGIGGRLLDAALDDARTRGAAAMFLEVGAGNAAAVALYGSRGFRRVGRRAGYYRVAGKPPEDALVLRLDLGGGLD